jgi:hypothetical protein
MNEEIQMMIDGMLDKDYEEVLKENRYLANLQQKIAIMQAYADGRQIQVTHKNSPYWTNCIRPEFNWADCNYRIKPIPKIVPYDSIQEMCNAIKNNGRQITNYSENIQYCINTVSMDCEDSSLSVVVFNNREYTFSFESLAKGFYFSSNKKPCGNVVEKY